MKKRIRNILFFLGLLSSLHAQNYTFEHFEQAYAYLQGDSSISEGIPWYNETWDLPLGFHFRFMGRDFEQLTAWNENLFFDYEHEDLFIFPYTGGYLLDKGFVTSGTEILSPISVKYEGTPGNKIFKFQCRNAGFEEGGAQDSVNFQIWLYETSNVIEFHYGPVNIVSDVWDPGFQGPAVGLLSEIDNSGYLVGGNPEAPSATFFDPSNPNAPGLLLSGPPPSGVVWRFTPQSSSAGELPGANGLTIWPNPCTDWLQITSPRLSEGSLARVFDLTGRLLLEQNTGEKSRMALGTLPPGVYCLSISAAGVPHTQIFIKE